GQLAGSLDLGMACEHLFEQGGAGTRKADDEDRNALVDRLGIERADERRMDGTLDLGDLGGELARIVAKAFGALAVALGIVLEGFAVAGPVVQGPGQGEVQRGAVALVDGDGDRFAHSGYVVVGQDRASYAGKAPPRLAAFEIHVDRPAIGRDGLVDASGRAQAVPPGDPPGRLVGMLSNVSFLELHR